MRRLPIGTLRWWFLRIGLGLELVKIHLQSTSASYHQPTFSLLAFSWRESTSTGEWLKSLGEEVQQQPPTTAVVTKLAPVLPMRGPASPSPAPSSVTTFMLEDVDRKLKATKRLSSNSTKPATRTPPLSCGTAPGRVWIYLRMGQGRRVLRRVR